MLTKIVYAVKNIFEAKFKKFILIKKNIKFLKLRINVKIK
jgi:hypothetical protein